MWGKFLSSYEADYCEQLLGVLENVPWALPLVRRVGPSANWDYQSRPLLFELRFAGDLHETGLSAEYEHSAGVGDSTVDFRFKSSGVNWLVELVSLMESDAVTSASWERGVFFGAALYTDSDDRRQSEEGELLLAQQKIGEKVLSSGQPVKFPPPRKDRYHVILVDMRGFGLTGGDQWDYHEIAYGRAGLPSDKLFLAHTWEDDSGNRLPVLGLFDQTNTFQRAARVIQERIHFIGFCNDKKYGRDTMRSSTIYLPNPHLFTTNDAARKVWDQYPLKRDDNGNVAA